MNRAFALYIFGVISTVLAAVFSSLPWISLVAFLVILPLGAILVWNGQGRKLGELGFRLSEGWPRQLATGILFGLLIPVLFLSILRFAGWISLISKGESLQVLIAYLPPVLIRMILVVAIEEFLFRGYFLDTLSRGQNLGRGIVLSSLLWGGSHLGSMVSEGLPAPLIQIGLATFLAWGITLCLCYLLAARSLWLPYGLHLGVNLSFSIASWLFTTQPNAPQWWIGHPSWMPESGLIGPVIWLIVAFITYMLYSNAMVTRLVKGGSLVR